MDHEASIVDRLNKLEIKSQITEYLLNRLKHLTTLKSENEYEYAELLGRINEIELFLHYFKLMTTQKTQNDE
jgi:hypothetical protein